MSTHNVVDRGGIARLASSHGCGVHWLVLALVLCAVGACPGPARGDAAAGTTRSEDPGELLQLGTRHLYGVGAPQNVDRAIELYCRAAALGSGEAQFRLGDLYARHVTGKQDEVLAAAWWLRASLSGYGSAKSQLARWDLSSAELPAEPACVKSADMLSRTLPRPQPEPAASKPATEPAPEPAPEPPVASVDLGRNPERAEIERLVRHLAPTFGLNPDVVLALIEVESNFRPRARSPKQAQGLMQLIPATARRFGVSDPWDPEQNLRGGMAYLRWLLDHFDGNLRLALAGYNAGENAVQRYGGVPPYAETQNYVRRIARLLGVAEEELWRVRSGPAMAGFPRPQAADERSRDERERDFESRFFDLDGPSG